MRARKFDYMKMVAEYNRIRKAQPLATMASIAAHLAAKYDCTPQNITRIIRDYQ